MSKKSSTKSKSEKEVGNVSENECALCKTDKDGCNDWLQCEVCDKWFHAICAGVKKKIFDACRDMMNLHWICEDCNPVATKLRTLKMLTKMYEKQEAMEKDMEYLKNEVVAVRDLTGATQKDSQSMCAS